MGSAGRSRKTHASGRRNKEIKRVLRKTFESRHIDQVWEDVRRNPQEVYVAGKTGPSGTTNK